MAQSYSVARVQYVSKPVIGPFSDGSKCLVRDLCRNLDGFEPHVMGAGAEVPELGPRAVVHHVYSAAGGFSPALRQNMQAALWMLTQSRAQIWHFLFAPNPRSSGVARTLKRLRRVPTVQTIASPPRSFARPDKLLFGDVCVAQSKWTLDMFQKAFQDEGKPCPKLVFIPPPAPLVEEPSEERMRAALRHVGLQPGAPVFLYPGDLEVSQGAAMSVRLAQELPQKLPGARVVIAYRSKTPRAEECAAALRPKADPNVVSFAADVPDIFALVKASTALLFPVDDLYGKVDLPIVLLEAMRLHTPVLALNEGPLKSLEGAELLENVDEAWLSSMVRVATEDSYAEHLRARGTEAVRTFFAPERVAAEYMKLYRELL